MADQKILQLDAEIIRKFLPTVNQNPEAPGRFQTFVRMMIRQILIIFFKFLKSNPNFQNLTLKGLHHLKPLPFIESLESLYELKKLNLTSCYQMTQIGKILMKFSSTLTSLKLKNVQISVHSLPAIFKCKNLKILNLSNSLSRSNEVKFEEKESINDPPRHSN